MFTPPGWTWVYRGEFAVGTLCASALLVGMSSGTLGVGWIAFSTIMLVALGAIPKFGLTLQFFALITPVLLLYVLLWEGVERLTSAGRARNRVQHELDRIAVNASVERMNGDLRIALSKPFRLGSCQEVVSWRGTEQDALGCLGRVPTTSCQSGFLTAFGISPSEGPLARLAEELDRVGISQARTRGRSSWVKATYDPGCVNRSSEVVLERQGRALDEPAVELGGPAPFRAFDRIDQALAALERIPDDAGARSFWIEVGNTAGERSPLRR